jgi:hypothetical protein
MRAAVAPGESLLMPRYEVIRGNVHRPYRPYGGIEIEAISLLRLTRDMEAEIGDDADAVLSESRREGDKPLSSRHSMFTQYERN